MDFTLEEQFGGFLKTPQIFAKNDIFEYPLFTTSASTLKKAPEDLTEPETRVLGKRMEHFFNYYITHFTKLEVLANNRQIIQDKLTLGEIDFLLKDPASKQVSHVELIYKFYLYNPYRGTSEKDHLIGPNNRDSLNRKLERLQKRQFPLLFHPATQDLLNTYEILPEEVLQKMCFKAYVFLPKQEQKIELSEINSAGILGYWIRYNEFTEKEYGKNLFFSPKKIYWPLEPNASVSWLSYSEVFEQVRHFMEKELSLLIWMKTPAGNIEKFFVVWW